MTALRIIGIGLSLSGLALFIAAIVRSPGVLIDAAHTPAFWLSLLSAAASIFLSFMLSAYNWHILLTAFGANQPFRIVGSVFLITQIGKYLPGNVGHLIGRAMIMKSYAIPIGASAKAMLMETIALLVVGSGLVALLLHDWLFSQLRMFPALASFTLGAIFLVSAIVAVYFRNWISELVEQMWMAAVASRSRFLAVAFIDLINFALNGLALWAAALMLYPDIPINFPTCLGVAAASFLIGYVTPGAPGGLGVREATTIILLTPIYGGAGSAALALVVRLGATLSDLIGFAVGSVSLAWHSRAESAPIATALPSRIDADGQVR